MLESERYANAFSEVLEILFCIPQSQYQKLPKKLLRTLEENCNPNYEFYYNSEKELDEQNVSEEAKAIISLIYRDYWADDKQRYQIIEKEKQELQIIEKQKNEKYSYENLFQNNKNIKNTSVSNSSQNELIVAKDNFFKRILKKLKQLFRL